MESGSGAAFSAVGRAQTDSPVASSATVSTRRWRPLLWRLGQLCLRSASAVTRWFKIPNEGSEEESEDENGTNSDGSTSNDGFLSKPGRVRQETGDNNGAVGSEDPSETAPGLRSQELADAVSGPATSLTAAAVQVGRHLLYRVFVP